MIQINKETYKIDSKNYYKRKFPKKQIILAGSLRKENYHIKRLTKKDYGKTKTWCTFSISRDGIIYQHYDPKYYTDFMGIKDVDKHSISIVLENMGMLFYDFKTGKYLNWIHEECDEELVLQKKWNGWTYWERYTIEQFDSVIELCKYLCDEHLIEVDSIGHNVHFEYAKKFEGIVTRSNFDSNYTDLNPSFDFRKFLDILDIEYE